jgi:hypothetical protein
MKKTNFKRKYSYLIITLPIYILYIFVVVLVLGAEDDTWEALVKKVKRRVPEND